MKKTLFCAVVAVLTSGCATGPDKIPTAYVSPLQYKDYNCNQIAGEMERVGRRVSELNINLKNKSDNDATQMGVGMVLFWPTLFFLEGGDGPEAQEYARLKGEREALERVAVQKECSAGIVPRANSGDTIHNLVRCKTGTPEYEGNRDILLF